MFDIGLVLLCKIEIPLIKVHTVQVVYFSSGLYLSLLIHALSNYQDIAVPYFRIWSTLFLTPIASVFAEKTT